MCATLINHGERLIMPSSHYMHSPINAVNELPLLTYDATTVWPRTYRRCRPGPSRGVGAGSGGRGDPATWGGTVELHRMGHYAWDSSGGGVRVCARTGLLVGVCVRACVRETVCAITFMAVFLQFCSSWSSHRLWTSHSSKDWRAGRMEEQKTKQQTNKWVALVGISIHSRCFALSFQENWNDEIQHCTSPPLFLLPHHT